MKKEGENERVRKAKEVKEKCQKTKQLRAAEIYRFPS